MAPPSPRRSSRARASNSQSQQSSVSSGTSGRLERSTRSGNKPSSGKSTPSASLSSEPLEDLDDTLLGRRRRRGQDDDSNEKNIKNDNFDMANGSDDLQEEEDEAVRCICGSEDYPGRPPVDGPDADFFAAIELTEDVTGFYVQCDICKVWQHGACVGIFSAESSPDEYFCEQCRKDLHKIHAASNGQKYSKYLPLHRPSRSTSRAASIVKEGTRSPKSGTGKNGRAASTSHSSKRRSTMNSRDAAYDDEQLRRAIEASKEDAPAEGAEHNTRRTKRGRSDSEESVDLNITAKDEGLTSIRNHVNVKRQRTSSRSASPVVEPVEVVARDESEDESGTRNGVKKQRNGKPQREKSEKSEKEEKERQRQEAANKRKGRAERRRADGTPPTMSPQASEPNLSKESDPSDETPVPTITAKPVEIAKSTESPVAIVELPPPVVAAPVPDTPPTTLAPPVSSHKRGGRSHQKKGKGRNQYTRDRDGDHDNSPARSMSRDVQKSAEESTGHSKSSGNDHKHGSKAKSSLANKMSMSDMKRRVTAIMDFISRTQVDLAAEALPGQIDDFKSGQASPQKTPVPQVNGNSSNHINGVGERAMTPDSTHDKDFKELNCMEMMDVLTRDMVRWQNQYS